MDPGKVRIIDISPFVAEHDNIEHKKDKENVLKAWTESFQTLGFVIVVGHGIETEVIGNLYSDAINFFSQDKETKMKFNISSEFGKGGYTPVGTESWTESVNEYRSKEVKHAPPNYVETLLFFHEGDERDVVPENPDRLRLSIQTYVTKLKNLLRLILKISSLSLGRETDFFENLYQGLDEMAHIRLSFYPAQDKQYPLPNQIRLGAHTDFCGFTILRQDENVGGLEVKGADESWIPVQLVKNAFVINAGDYIQMWTNNFWKSNLHRVVNPTKELAHLSRMSIVYFSGPHSDAIIKPQEYFCSEKNPPRYEAIKSRDHIAQKLKLSLSKV